MNQTLALAVEIVGRDGGAAAVIERARQGIGGLVSTLGRVGLAGMGLQAVTSGARELGNALGLGLASEMEQVRAQFLAFTKDAALTDDLLARVRAEADKTPFSFRELATATAGLIPASKQAKVPLDDLIKTAEILAASNPAQGLEGAALALREAVSGDFVSVVERFNLPRQRINELKEQGVPALKAVQTAMREMGFDADLVANMAGTAAGKWSTFMDTVDGIKARLATPIFEGLKAGLGEAQVLLDANKESIAAVATALGQGLAAAVAAVLTGARDLAGTIGAVNRFLNDNKVVTGGLVAVLGAATTAYGLMTAAALAQNAVSLTMTTVTKAVTAAQWLLNAAMTANPIGLLVVAIGGLVAALVYAYQNSEEFRSAVDTAWEAVKAATATAWAAIQPVLRALGDLWGWLAEHVPTMASDLSAAVTSTIQGLADFLSRTWEAIKTAAILSVGLMVSIITGDWQSASVIWQGIMTGLSTALTPIWEGIKSTVTTKAVELKDNAILAWEVLKTGAVAVATALKDDVVKKVGELVSGALALFEGGPTAFVPRLLAILTGLAADVWTSVASDQPTSLKSKLIAGLKAAVDAAVNSLSNVYERLVGPFQSAWNKISSLLEAIKRAAREAARALSGIGGGGGGDAGGDGGVGSSSVGARAMGGPVTAGRPYIVGELGPEVIVPRAAGTVVPNRALGGGDTYHVTVNVPRWINDADRIADDIHEALLRKKRRGATMGLA